VIDLTQLSPLDRVLAVFAQSPTPMTVPEIAEALDCALITARRHITTLVETGQVRMVGSRPRLDRESGALRSGRGHQEYRIVSFYGST
jgi:DNA-binding IclR family transcriptional regulator